MRRFFLIVCLASLVLASPAEARIFGRRNGGGGGGGQAGGIPAGMSNQTAQGVAEIQAATERMGHYGGNPGYEGCACASTAAAAYANCCYGNSGMPTHDYGLAQGKSGMWYACRRYGTAPAGYAARFAKPKDDKPAAVAKSEAESSDAESE
jgi:hypothetical protein